MIIEKSGWYREDDKGNLELIASTKDELIEYLDNERDLDDIVTQYICDNFDMEDFIREKMYDREYMNREDMIEDFKEHEITEGTDFDTGWKWYEWFEEGTDIEGD